MIEKLTYRLGEAGTVGWIIEQADGTLMLLEGLQLRMRIFFPDGAATLPGYATTGEFMIDGSAVQSGAVMAVDIDPADITAPEANYSAVREINDGTGWRALPAGEFQFNVRVQE